MKETKRVFSSMGPADLGAFEEWLHEKSREGLVLQGSKACWWIFTKSDRREWYYTVAHKSEEVPDGAYGEKVTEWNDYTIYRSAERIAERRMDTAFLREDSDSWVEAIVMGIALLAGVFLVAMRLEEMWRWGDWVWSVFSGRAAGALFSALAYLSTAAGIVVRWRNKRKLRREGNHYTLQMRRAGRLLHRAMVWPLFLSALVLGIAGINLPYAESAPEQVDVAAVAALMGGDAPDDLAVESALRWQTALMTDMVRAKLTGGGEEIRYTRYESALIPLAWVARNLEDGGARIVSMDADKVECLEPWVDGQLW